MTRIVAPLPSPFPSRWLLALGLVAFLASCAAPERDSRSARNVVATQLNGLAMVDNWSEIGFALWEPGTMQVDAIVTQVWCDRVWDALSAACDEIDPDGQSCTAVTSWFVTHEGPRCEARVELPATLITALPTILRLSLKGPVTEKPAEPQCGDGTVDENEACDDGNLAAGDGCSSTCAAEVCGNAILDPGEACDDGNLAQGDGCAPTCIVEACGNNIIEPG